MCGFRAIYLPSCCYSCNYGLRPWKWAHHSMERSNGNGAAALKTEYCALFVAACSWKRYYNTPSYLRVRFCAIHGIRVPIVPQFPLHCARPNTEHSSSCACICCPHTICPYNDILVWVSVRVYVEIWLELTMARRMFTNRGYPLPIFFQWNHDFLLFFLML